MSVREKIEMIVGDGSLILFDDLDDAIIGVADNGEVMVTVYSYDKCVEIFMDINSWTSEESIEWVDYNVLNQNMGINTPIFVFHNEIFQGEV